MSFFPATYGQAISGLSPNGQPVQAAVFNDNQVRAAAGLALALAAVALVYGRFENVYLPMQAISTFLFIEFLIRVTIGILLWMESVLSICVGCEFHGFMVKQGWVQKDSAFEICAHGVCEVPRR
jgi:hypothetical protein